jgi:lysophospholipase L1-like esterase
MGRGRRRGRARAVLAAGVAVLAMLALSACKADTGASGPGAGGTGGGAKGPLPSSMAAIGDSISSGYGTCLVLSDCPRNSWSTGGGAIVSSHYKRILSGNKAIQGHAANYAEAGATAGDLTTQAARAAATRPAYLTVMIGANDACRPSEAEMTPPDVFAAEVGDALSRVKALSPQTSILVVSIPNIYHLWEIGHTSRVARGVWADRICPSLLANPESTAPADTQRRQAFRDRIDAFDAALAAACKTYGPRCRWDGGAVHAFAFTMSDVSALDFFHPNATGQSEIARLTYPDQFGWGGTSAA